MFPERDIEPLTNVTVHWAGGNRLFRDSPNTGPELMLFPNYPKVTAVYHSEEGLMEVKQSMKF